MYRNILVAVDGSPASNAALQEVARLASPDAVVHVIHVVEVPAWTVPLEQDVVFDVELLKTSLVDAGRAILERAGALLRRDGIKVHTQLIDAAATGVRTICDAVLLTAEALAADVIVVGSHGRRGFNRLLMGSVTESLLRSARLPMLVVRTEAPAGETSGAPASGAAVPEA